MTKFFKRLIKKLKDFDYSDDERLYKEFEKRKQQIKTNNYLKLMQERLIPFERDFELTSTGILLTDQQLFERAHQRFCQAKLDGKLDELNSIIEV